MVSCTLEWSRKTSTVLQLKAHQRHKSTSIGKAQVTSAAAIPSVKERAASKVASNKLLVNSGSRLAFLINKVWMNSPKLKGKPFRYLMVE